MNMYVHFKSPDARLERKDPSDSAAADGAYVDTKLCVSPHVCIKALPGDTKIRAASWKSCVNLVLYGLLLGKY